MMLQLRAQAEPLSDSVASIVSQCQLKVAVDWLEGFGGRSASREAALNELDRRRTTQSEPFSVHFKRNDSLAGRSDSFAKGSPTLTVGVLEECWQSVASGPLVAQTDSGC